LQGTTSSAVLQFLSHDVAALGLVWAATVAAAIVRLLPSLLLLLLLRRRRRLRLLLPVIEAL
jgi:hypothetical protein